MKASAPSWTEPESNGLDLFESVQAHLFERTLVVMSSFAVVASTVMLVWPALRSLAWLPLVFVVLFEAGRREVRRGRVRGAFRLIVWSSLVFQCVFAVLLGGVVGVSPMFMVSGALMALLWLPFAEAASVALVYLAWMGVLSWWVPEPILDGMDQPLWLMACQLIAMAESAIIVGVSLDTLQHTSEASDRRAAEARAARRAATEAARSKTAFLAMMSHELRTPLNAIIGYAGLLREDEATGAEDLSRIEGTGRVLLGLVEDVLELARSESTPAPPLGVVDLAQAARAVAGARAEVTGPPSLHAWSDEGTVRQILEKLIVKGARVALGEVDGRVTATLWGPAYDGPGATLRLTLAQQLADRVGGSLVLGSEADDLRWTLTLPGLAP